MHSTWKKCPQFGSSVRRLPSWYCSRQIEQLLSSGASGCPNRTLGKASMLASDRANAISTARTVRKASSMNWAFAPVSLRSTSSKAASTESIPASDASEALVSEKMVRTVASSAVAASGPPVGLIGWEATCMVEAGENSASSSVGSVRSAGDAQVTDKAFSLTLLMLFLDIREALQVAKPALDTFLGVSARRRKRLCRSSAVGVSLPISARAPCNERCVVASASCRASAARIAGTPVL
mmetsp:Transcript_35368/g.76499  ORF Transcript_35368/g.76499 Transcript_35368/m.76499 type:complete len:238 (+) Transcript_35368:170-883(+)